MPKTLKYEVKERLKVKAWGKYHIITKHKKDN